MRHFSNNDAEEYMKDYIKNDAQGYSTLISVEYQETIDGEPETCGGCTLGDGMDCWPPRHYINKFFIISKNNDKFKGERHSYLYMGWSEGDKDCSNAFGDYNEVELIGTYYDSAIN